MSEEKQNQKTGNGTIQLRTLLQENGIIEYTTTGGVLLALSLDLLDKLVDAPPNIRRPNKAELMMYANMAIEQRCNPYLNECWLVYMKGAYRPIVAAQKRIGKAQSLPNYDGYEWGWIDINGTRHPFGVKSTIKSLKEIIGCWGQVNFKDRKTPFYHEIYLSEYQVDKETRPVSKLLKVLRDQTHRYAFANEMGNLNTENEVAFIESPTEKTTPNVPKREERKAVDAEIKDTNRVLRDELEKCVQMFKAKLIGAGYPDELNPESLMHNFAAFAFYTFGGQTAADWLEPTAYNLNNVAELANVLTLGIPKPLLEELIPVPQTAKKEGEEFFGK